MPSTHPPTLDDQHPGRSQSSVEPPQPTDDANTTRSSVEPTAPPPSSTPSSANWQAIWSPVHNAYYFYNTTTHETTWVNPLQPDPAASQSETPTTPADPSPSTSSSAPASTQQQEGPSAGPSSGAAPVPASLAQIYALQEVAAAQGIDPSLAHLDPSLAGPSAPGGTYNFAARFNAHTGTFTRPDGRDPTHLSEYERMKRMSSVYFDMGQWEQDVAQQKQQEDEDAANGKKRKRPTKKDLVGSPGVPLVQLTHCDSCRNALRSRSGSRRSQRQLGCARRSRRVLNFYSRG